MENAAKLQAAGVITVAEARDSILGHNNPPTDVDLLDARLKTEYSALFLSSAAMVESMRQIMHECANEEDSGTISDLIANSGKKVKELDKTREAEKAPYLALERKVDSTFKTSMDSLNTERHRINAIQTKWLMKKAAEERRRREDEATALREKAAQELEAATQLEQQGMTHIAEKVATEARISEMTANKVESTIADKPASLAKSRGVGGAVSSLRTEWKGVLEKREILDLSALRPYFTDDSLQKAINAYVKAGHKQLTGARIFEDTTAATR